MVMCLNLAGYGCWVLSGCVCMIFSGSVGG
jgi:hypothetical protein